MRFDWDDKKNQLNFRKPGISFDLAMMVFLDDNRIEYYDDVHSDPLRIISARKATTMEEEAYYERL